MANKGPNKGNRGERELCSVLEEHLGGSWIKTPGSGSYVGGKNKVRIEKLDENQTNVFKADVILPDNLYGIVVESKFYKDLPMHNLLKETGNPTIDSWIYDLEFDAGEENWAWLCIKLNRKGWFIGVRSTESQMFKLNNRLYYQPKNDCPEYCFTNLKEFLSNNKDTILQECSRT